MGPKVRYRAINDWFTNNQKYRPMSPMENYLQKERPLAWLPNDRFSKWHKHFVMPLPERSQDLLWLILYSNACYMSTIKIASYDSITYSSTIQQWHFAHCSTALNSVYNHALNVKYILHQEFISFHLPSVEDEPGYPFTPWKMPKTNQ